MKTPSSKEYVKDFPVHMAIYWDEFLRVLKSKNFALIAGSSISSIFLSHVLYMFEKDIFTRVYFDEEFLIFYYFVAFFSLSFATYVFLSGHKSGLVVKQFLMSSVSILSHRLFYGVERAGSLFFNLMFIGACIVLVKYLFANNREQDL